jgi:hypothetical protein
MAAGRPRKQVDLALAEELAGIFCTQEEIAGILKVSVDTLQRNKDFCGMYKRAQETAKSSLRRAQFKKAMEGNVVMQIWLGKQYLGQSDKQQISGPEEGPIQIAQKMPDEEIEKRVKKYYGIRDT